MVYRRYKQTHYVSHVTDNDNDIYYTVVFIKMDHHFVAFMVFIGFFVAEEECGKLCNIIDLGA